MRRPWTNEDDVLLESLLVTCSLPNAARKLNRTISALRERIRQLDLGDTREHKGYTINQFSKFVDKDPKTVWRWVNEHGMKATKRKIVKSHCYYIDTEDFWEWAYHNKHRVNFDAIESLPPEPDWFKRMRG